MYPLKGNQDPAPRLHYCYLTAPPLSLHPFPSLISNCLKGFCAQEPHRVLLSFTFLHHNLVSVDWLCCTSGKQTQVWFGKKITQQECYVQLKTGLKMKSHQTVEVEALKEIPPWRKELHMVGKTE